MAALEVIQADITQLASGTGVGGFPLGEAE
jgi:hypothetical protein